MYNDLSSYCSKVDRYHKHIHKLSVTHVVSKYAFQILDLEHSGS